MESSHSKYTSAFVEDRKEQFRLNLRRKKTEEMFMLKRIKMMNELDQESNHHYDTFMQQNDL